MSGYNLPDDWSWKAFEAYYGDNREPEEDFVDHGEECGCGECGE